MPDENDSYTEVIQTSWGSRFGNSFRGTGLGPALIAIAAVLTYWNEGRTVRSSRALSVLR